MKRKLIVATVAVAVVGGTWLYLGGIDKVVDVLKNEDVVYQRPEVVVEKELVDNFDARVEAAIEAAMPDIERKAQAAYDKVVLEEKEKVVDAVIETRIEELEGSLSKQAVDY